MSNTTRPINVIRRRPNLIDILVPKDPAVQGYRLNAASAFDGSFTTILTAPISSGFLDANVDRAKLHAVNNRDHIRIVFDPQTFNGVAGIKDAQKFWLTYQPVDFGGTPGAASAPMLILTENDLRGDVRFQFSGDVPTAATVAGSLQLDLPMRMQDVTIRNNEASGGNDVFVAFEAGGAETQITPEETVLFQMGSLACILVRAGTGTPNITVTGTSFLPL